MARATMLTVEENNRSGLAAAVASFVLLFGNKTTFQRGFVGICRGRVSFLFRLRKRKKRRVFSRQPWLCSSLLRLVN